MKVNTSQAKRLAGAIRQRREALGLTQEQASHAAGFGDGASTTTWRYLEYGRRRNLRSETIIGLMTALRWTRAEILAAAGLDDGTGLVLRWDGPGESFTAQVHDADAAIVDRVRRALRSPERWSVTWVNPPAGATEVPIQWEDPSSERAQLASIVRLLPEEELARAIRVIRALAGAHLDHEA